MADLVGLRVVQEPSWTFRLLPGALTELGISPRGVIHVGAHHGEEVPVYRACGFDAVTLVEPDPCCCDVIAGQSWASKVAIVRAACAPAASMAMFYRATDDVFSGLTPNPDHPAVGSFDVPTMPVSAIQFAYPANVLVVDTQGTELDVLRSADLSALDLVIIETQDVGLDAYGAYWPTLMGFAGEVGWLPAIQWAREPGWADTLLIPRR